MSKDRDPQSRNRVVPRLEYLEDRLLPLSMMGGIPGWPSPHCPPRTGGIAVQTGSTLGIDVASPFIPGFGPSFTLIVEDGRGNVAASWDGLPFHFFSGVNSIWLGGEAPVNVGLLVSLGPLQSPQQVNLPANGFFNAFVGLVPPIGGQLSVQANPGVHTLVL